MFDTFAAMSAMGDREGYSLLKVLVRYRTLNASQASKQTGKTVSEVQATLDKFVAVGLVSVDSDGNYAAKRSVINDVRRAVEDVLFQSQVPALTY